MNNSEGSKHILIAGGGLVGSLLSIYLSKRSHHVEIVEKRPDPRIASIVEGRSINLAVSHRGLHALKEVGLEEAVKKISIPMKGRMIHKEDGALNFQPYGEEGQYINSISRNELNKLLIQKAEDSGVKFQFNTHVDSVDFETLAIQVSGSDKKSSTRPDAVFGADGAFSEIRKGFHTINGFTEEKEFLSHGYKELHIPPGEGGKHLLEKNALHIWPREQFMLIALPNTDGSFTATLFLPFTGNHAFEKLTDEDSLFTFFKNYFSDALPLLPDLKKDFFSNPPSSLVTVRCYPWIYKDKVALVGDAAHAITPFYGQGMNAGFEDCRILNQILEEKKDLNDVFTEFQTARKKNADAIAELALQNFIEMRDLVNDPQFILRKKIEGLIHQKYPSYLPLYTMVTFSDLPYEQALAIGKEHDEMMNKVLKIKNLSNRWNTEEGWKEIEKIISIYIKKG